jgi:metallo-beta-lactamase family protein
MAVAATHVFRAHPECFDDETYSQFIDGYYDPFGFQRLEYITRVEDSIKLNTKEDPHIIISASGMAEGGRILHHLRNNLDNPNNCILFVGYAAENTLARRIMDGADRVNIFGFPHRVQAHVKSMDYFSAHADRNGLEEYVGYSKPSKLKNIFLVHGEQSQALPLREDLLRKGYSHVHYPETGEAFDI